MKNFNLWSKKGPFTITKKANFVNVYKHKRN